MSVSDKDTGSGSAKQLWQQFCRELEAAGEQVMSTDASPREQAEGMRYLSRLLRISLEMNLEFANPQFPGFYKASHETAKIGADNPDNIYLNASVSGQHNYRLTGHRGTVPIMSFGTKANRYAVDGTMASTGELDIRDMEIDDDGRFEIIVSREKAEGNWLPLAEDSSMLLVRQTFFDRNSEQPGAVKIETLDGPDAPPAPNLSDISAALSRSNEFVSGTSGLFLNWAETFRQNNFNALNTVDQTPFFKAGGDPMIFYLHGWWELEPGQALKITTEVPDCEGWNFQLNNIWMESLEYRYNKVHVNNKSASYNADGTVTIIISDTQPDTGNWINTTGLTRGTMLLRWTGADTHPVPETEVITL